MTSTLAADPTYLAYMRALGFEAAEASNQAARQVGNVKAKQALELPQIQMQGEVSRENIAGNFEGRGLLRSGAYLKGDARQRAGQQFQENALALGTATRIGDIEGDLARQIAGLGRQHTERALIMGQQQYVDEQTLPYRS